MHGEFVVLTVLSHETDMRLTHKWRGIISNTFCVLLTIPGSNCVLVFQDNIT